MTITRRQFLTATAAGATAPVWLRLGGFIGEAGAATAPIPARLLLVVFMQGGNDGLNTVVPYLDSEYRRARPTVALPASSLLDIGSGFALHSSLPYIQSQWSAGRVAIVHNVGYAKPNFSHFVSTTVWETASAENRFATGWLGRYLDRTDTPGRGPVRALGLASEMPLTLTGDKVSGIAADSLSDFNFGDATDVHRDLRYRALAEFGAAGGGNSMNALVARRQQQMLTAVSAIEGLASHTDPHIAASAAVAEAAAGGLGTEIGFVTLPGFDSHAGQRGLQAYRLGQLDDAVKQFYTTAAQRGIADRAAVLVFSEFGRRVPENASNGTDHGAAGPVFMIGPRVRGGFYGARPNLAALNDGNLVAQFDLRQIYATVLEQHLRTPSTPILGTSATQLPLFK